jgi:transcription elongation GreA/GreB family factor
MSRAFVKESDDEAAAGDMPERPVPTHPNYVTARGLVQLQARERELAGQHEALKLASEYDSAAKQKLREVERDLRYVRAQLERAELVQHVPAAEAAAVHFGATVVIEDHAGARQRYRIVGDDEADATAGDISWASPLARALIGARAGDTVTWRRPAGESEIDVVEIRYDGA